MNTYDDTYTSMDEWHLLPYLKTPQNPDKNHVYTREQNIDTKSFLLTPELHLCEFVALAPGQEQLPDPDNQRHGATRLRGSRLNRSNPSQHARSRPPRYWKLGTEN
jgi:hypothetical protein